MGGDKVSRTSGVAAHNNMTGDGSGPGRKYAASGAAESMERRLSDGRPSDKYTATLTKAQAMEQELQGFLKMMEQNNHRIRDIAGRMRVRENDEPDTLPVPSVLGLTVSAGTARLSAAGFIVSRLSARPHPNTPVGQIVGQVPEPGMLAAPGSGIHMYVSKGPYQSVL